MRAGERGILLTRIGTLVAVCGAVWFAVQGGEFSSLDLVRQRRQQASLHRTIDSVQRVVDSLKRYSDKVQHDPTTQERIAREVFGMVRGDKELLYRFTDAPDSTANRPP